MTSVIHHWVLNKDRQEWRCLSTFRDMPEGFCDGCGKVVDMANIEAALGFVMYGGYRDVRPDASQLNALLEAIAAFSALVATE